MSDASDFDDVERHRVQTHRHEVIARINDVAHFHREYKRLVGFPPIRDIEQLRNAASEHNGYVHVEDQPDALSILQRSYVCTTGFDEMTPWRKRP